jgi:hypothetical protein
MEKAGEFLTDRIDDDDVEKWATVSIYRISSNYREDRRRAVYAS